MILPTFTVTLVAFAGTALLTRTTMMEVLKEMAEDGLRTLCLGGRELSQDEFVRAKRILLAAGAACHLSFIRCDPDGALPDPDHPL